MDEGVGSKGRISPARISRCVAVRQFGRFVDNGYRPTGFKTHGPGRCVLVIPSDAGVALPMVSND